MTSQTEMHFLGREQETDIEKIGIIAICRILDMYVNFDHSPNMCIPHVTED